MLLHHGSQPHSVQAGHAVILMLICIRAWGLRCSCSGARLLVIDFILMHAGVLQGAETSIYLASSPEVEGVASKYFVDCKPVSSRLVAILTSIFSSLALFYGVL